MRPVPALALTLASAVLAGCGTAEGGDPTAHPDVSEPGSSVRVVEEADADLVLWVSNQSFDDPLARLTVAVDGVTVVADDFHVEGQHHWVKFPLQAGPGRHELTAESDSGASLTRSFRLPADGRRYAVVDHWTYDEDPPELTWLFRRRPVAFA